MGNDKKDLQVRIIKRYANRKLYDTRTSAYITIAEIGKLIKAGEEIKVVDHKTGEDITPVILAQILLDEEKRDGRTFSSQTLKVLISQGEDAIEFIKGAITNVKGEAERRVEWLERRISGKDDLKRYINIKELVVGLQRSLTDFQQQVEEKLESIGSKLAVVGQLRREIIKLAERLKQFEERLERLERMRSGRKKEGNKHD